MQQPQRYDVEIVDVIPTATNANIYVLDLGGKPFDYRVGQFIQIFFDPATVLKYAEDNLAKGSIKQEDMDRIRIRAKKNTREYSLSSTPTRPGYLEVIIEHVDGGAFTPWFLENAKVGDKIKIAGPFGKFFFNDSHKNVCFVAAGSGIAPIMAMIRNIIDKNLDGKYILIYSSRTRQQISYRRELDEIAFARKNFRVFHTLTRLTDQEKLTWKGYARRVDTNMVKECLSKVGLDPKDCYYYMCGSPGFMKAVCNPASRVSPDEPKGCLDDLGVEKERVFMEIF